MSDTKIAHAPQSPASLNEQNEDAANGQVSGALSAALPNALVTQAHTPPLIDAPRTATSEEVETTLAGIVHGHTDRGARHKAHSIMSIISDRNATPEKLGALQQILENNQDRVKQILHVTPNDSFYPNVRMYVRRAALAELYETGDLDKAETARNYMLLEHQIFHALADSISTVDWKFKAGKARDIIDKLPVEVFADCNRLRTLLQKLQSNSADVKRLLHFSSNHFDNRDQRLQIRADLLASLANGKSIEETKAQRDILLKTHSVISQLETVLDQGGYESPKERSKTILRQFSGTPAFADALSDIERCLKTNPDAVRQLLNAIPAGAGNGSQPAEVSAFLLEHLANGADPETIEAVKDLIADDPNHPVISLTKGLTAIQGIGPNQIASNNALELALIIADKAQSQDEVERIASACISEKDEIGAALSKLDQTSNWLNAPNAASARADVIIRAARTAQVIPHHINIIIFDGSTDTIDCPIPTLKAPVIADFRTGDERWYVEQLYKKAQEQEDLVGIAGKGFTHSIAGNNLLATSAVDQTQALILFYESDTGGKCAMLINLPTEEVDSLQSDLNSAINRYKKSDPTLTFHSINWIEVEPTGDKAAELEQSNADCKKALKHVAGMQDIPFNIIPRPHNPVIGSSDEPQTNPPPLSVIVFAPEAKIYIFPKSSHDDSDRFGDASNYPIPEDQAMLLYWLGKGVRSEDEPDNDHTAVLFRQSPDHIIEEEEVQNGPVVRTRGPNNTIDPLPDQVRRDMVSDFGLEPSITLNARFISDNGEEENNLQNAYVESTLEPSSTITPFTQQIVEEDEPSNEDVRHAQEAAAQTQSPQDNVDKKSVAKSEKL